MLSKQIINQQQELNKFNLTIHNLKLRGLNTMSRTYLEAHQMNPNWFIPNKRLTTLIEMRNHCQNDINKLKNKIKNKKHKLASPIFL